MNTFSSFSKQGRLPTDFFHNTDDSKHTDSTNNDGTFPHSLSENRLPSSYQYQTFISHRSFILLRFRVFVIHRLSNVGEPFVLEPGSLLLSLTGAFAGSSSSRSSNRRRSSEPTVDPTSSFRIRRNLLRRRHVRKEQKQKNEERTAQQRRQKLLEEQKHLQQVEQMTMWMSRKRPLEEEQARMDGGIVHRGMPFRSVMNANPGGVHHQFSSSHTLNSMGTIHHCASSIIEPISTPRKSETAHHNEFMEMMDHVETKALTTTLVRPQFVPPERPNKLRKLRHRVL